MQQTRSTAFPKHKNKERRRTNKNNTNATYETTDVQRKEELKQKKRLGTVSKKTTGGLNQFYSCETSSLYPDAAPNKSRASRIALMAKCLNFRTIRIIETRVYLNRNGNTFRGGWGEGRGNCQTAVVLVFLLKRVYSKRKELVRANSFLLGLIPFQKALGVQETNLK